MDGERHIVYYSHRKRIKIKEKCYSTGVSEKKLQGAIGM
jgi:hypothetical protein